MPFFKSDVTAFVTKYIAGPEHFRILLDRNKAKQKKKCGT